MARTPSITLHLTSLLTGSGGGEPLRASQAELLLNILDLAKQSFGGSEIEGPQANTSHFAGDPLRPHSSPPSPPVKRNDYRPPTSQSADAGISETAAAAARPFSRVDADEHGLVHVAMPKGVTTRGAELRATVPHSLQKQHHHGQRSPQSTAAHLGARMQGPDGEVGPQQQGQTPDQGQIPAWASIEYGQQDFQKGATGSSPPLPGSRLMLDPRGRGEVPVVVPVLYSQMNCADRRKYADWQLGRPPSSGPSHEVGR